MDSRIDDALQNLCDEHNIQLPRILEENARGMTQAHFKELSDRDTTITKLNVSLNEKESELKRTRNELNHLSNTKKSIDSRLKITTAETAKLRDQLLSTEQVFNSKDELYNELKATLVTLERKYHVVQGECQTSLLEIDSKKDFINKLEDSLASRQCEITRLKSTLNEDKAVAEKNLEVGRLNAAYNESIQLLDEKKQGIV